MARPRSENTYEHVDGCTILHLSKGDDHFEVKIDSSDVAKVIERSWRPLWNGRVYYVVSGTECLYLHRFIIEPPAGMDVDHKNHDTLDCRRGNLRVATRSQNLHNKQHRPTETSPFKGVRKANGKWQARLQIDGKNISLGCFVSPVEAARKYNEAAAEAFGEFALLNDLQDYV